MRMSTGVAEGLAVMVQILPVTRSMTALPPEGMPPDQLPAVFQSVLVLPVQVPAPAQTVLAKPATVRIKAMMVKCFNPAKHRNGL